MAAPPRGQPRRQTPDADRLLTKDDVAARLRVHPKTVQIWTTGGKFPFTALLPGKAGYRYSEANYAAFLAVPMPRDGRASPKWNGR